MLAFALLLVAVAPPDVRFVASTTAVVRAEAKDTARTVVDVGIGAPVAVLDVKGEWAHVVVAPRVFRLDALDGEAVPVAPRVFDKRLPQGFVRIVDLAATAPSRRALLAEAAELRADDPKRGALLLRAWALDAHDVDVAKVAAPTAKSITARRERSPVERADLVFGCSGDVARASVIAGSVASLGEARVGVRDDVCVAGLDVRAPCSTDPAQATQHRADMARLVPRYGNDGPALRLVLAPGAGEQPVWVVTRFLDVDGCVDCTPTAVTREVKVTRLRVPRVEKGTTLLHAQVPRAVGVVYSVVSAANREDVDDEPQSFELGDAFDADPRDEPGAGAHLFAAPDVCSCRCDGAADDVDDAP